MENSQFNRNLILGEWLTVAAIFVGCFVFLHSEIKSLEERLDSRMLSQERRIDKLYETFGDFLKEGRK